MKRLFNNKFALAVLLFGVLGFATISIGGEYLHNKIHCHQDAESKQQCPIFQILVQYFILAVAALASIQLGKSFCLLRPYRSFISKAYFLLPSPRAPPIV